MTGTRFTATATGLALALLCAGCVPMSAGKEHFAGAAPLCDVIANERSHSGKRVLASALLQRTPHGFNLYAPECNATASLNIAPGTGGGRARKVVDAAFVGNGRAQVPVVIDGVFEPWTRFENGVPIINAWGPVLRDARIVAARRP